MDIFLSVCQWVQNYYAWRSNLGDEADNHVMELAVAGQASYLVTRNVRDLRGGELKFPFELRSARGRGRIAEGLALLDKAAGRRARSKRSRDTSSSG